METTPEQDTHEATEPPSNPETDSDAIEQGEEQLDKISGN